MTEFVSGNRITLLRSGVEYFPALAAEFDAAQRGVATYVLVDGFGSKDLGSELIEGLRAAGVRFLVYRPNISPWTMRRARLRRMHRKVAVIDARVAFVGGINVIDDMDTPKHTPPRFDYAVRIDGPLVARIHRVVKRLWALVTATQFKSTSPGLRDLGPFTVPRGGQRAAFVVRDNVAHRRDIEQAYLAAIRRARSEIVIASAYFFPGQSFRRALMDAAARGVRVDLLLQGRVEYVLLHYASRALYGAFLDAGIEIHEYRKSFMHAKVAVIDRHWATVGSSNIDPFSFLLAREANVVIEDDGFAGQLRESLLAAMTKGAVQVRRESWAAQPLAVRALTWTSYGLARFLTGVFAYGRTREFT